METMQEDAPSGGGAEARATARTNLFMGATLHAADGTHQVKIRDLSAAGAQIEISVPLEVGSGVTLVRGSLRVLCRVTWCVGRRCGLQFTSPISVSDWMANSLNQQQQRVDQVVALAKAGAIPVEVSAKRIGVTSALTAEDLRRVSRLLENLGDALASDPMTVEKHGIQLQNLDIASQSLAALAEAVEIDGAVSEVILDRLSELRTSCTEALRSNI